MSALQLEAAASVLGPVVDKVVFVGGATVYLWITEPGAPPVRATEDVDVVCEVASRVEYYRLGERLRERGLQEAAGEPVLCRWRSADPQLVLDVMPTDPDILGFSNPWYEEAIATAKTITLDSGADIRAAKPVVLMATKLAAWKGPRTHPPAHSSLLIWVRPSRGRLLGQQMGQHAPQIPADPSGTPSAENRLKPSST